MLKRLFIEVVVGREQQSITLLVTVLSSPRCRAMSLPLSFFQAAAQFTPEELQLPSLHLSLLPNLPWKRLIC